MTYLSQKRALGRRPKPPSPDEFEEEIEVSAQRNTDAIAARVRTMTDWALVEFLRITSAQMVAAFECGDVAKADRFAAGYEVSVEELRKRMTR